MQRNTRVRGFVTEDKHFQDLQNQLAQCQQAVQTERDTVAMLREQLAQQSFHPAPSTSVAPGLPNDGSFGATLPSSFIRPDGAFDDSSYVIKHMGRMVHDEVGVGRFAGSTTGIHFVLSVEEACKRTLSFADTFPEGCHSLYLGQSANTYEPDSSSLHEDIGKCLNRPVSYYLEQIDVFCRYWESFCPLLARGQLVKDIERLVNKVQDHGPNSGTEETTLCILLSIMGINCLTHRMSNNHSSDTEPSERQYISVADRIQGHLVARADIGSLQALTIFAFYHQLSGRALSLIQLNGHMVRISQSLGLHRHARRFRLTVSETELRKRLWWWVYIFDRITSIVHGLPPLINDIDVDNDMPTDCRLHDINDTELLHPLPGQTTPVFYFNHYVTMGKKLSSILHNLYTTTQRRQGGIKIERLDRDIRVWSQNLDTIEDTANLMVFWLRLLTHLAMVLIHRPGLTFAENTPEFGTCLNTCVRSSTEVLHLLCGAGSDATLYFHSLSPIGPSLVFQCALMHVYCQCKLKALSNLGASDFPSLQESMGVIYNAVELLERYNQRTLLYSPGNSQHHSINATVKILKDVALALQQSDHGPEPLAEESWLAETPSLSFGGNSLYDLNYMTAMDWAQDISDTFGDLPGFPG